MEIESLNYWSLSIPSRTMCWVVHIGNDRELESTRVLKFASNMNSAPNLKPRSKHHSMVLLKWGVQQSINNLRRHQVELVLKSGLGILLDKGIFGF